LRRDHRPQRQKKRDKVSQNALSVAAFALLVCAAILADAAPAPSGVQGQRPALDATFLPTPDDVVTAMLRMAHVGPDDVVYDLGSGDGRIPIAAVKEFGAARGVGVDLDPVRNIEARENARRAGVERRVSFLTESLYDTDLRPATVVTLYMGLAVNLRMRPILQARLKPGSRVVSHVFGMGDWMPDETATINGRPVFLWAIR
jgi:hypothetical protein